MGTRLDAAANIATMVACAAVIAAMMVRYWPRSQPDPMPYKTGSALPHIQGFDYNSSSRTLLVVVKTTCVHCTASIPVYRALVRARDVSRMPLRIVVVGFEDVGALRRYALLHDFRPDEIVSTSQHALPILGTPVLVLADSNGRVIKTWLGEQNTEGGGPHEDLVASLFGANMGEPVRAALRVR